MSDAGPRPMGRWAVSPERVAAGDSRAMSAQLAPALLVLAFALCAHASVSDLSNNRYERGVRRHKVSRKVELPPGCLYGGRRHAEGARVRTREACLACACTGGALACRRLACAPVPAPPPNCTIEHRRGQCCPELSCPDGVKKLDQGASARLDDFEALGSIGHACVEGGTVYAAGSAMNSDVACEQCFCLGGARRCVRPRCLSSPEGCQAQPAAGACCPQRYYCQHIETTPSHENNPHDCLTEDGVWVPEGERVTSLGLAKECAQCFCLSGTIRCQSLSCAPKLKGCTPLVLPGQCCPHQYLCDHRTNDTIISNLFSKQDNLLVNLNENRSFHTSKSAKRETTVKAVSARVSKKPSSTNTTTITTTTTTTTTNKPKTTVKSVTKNNETSTRIESDHNKGTNDTYKENTLVKSNVTTQVPEIEVTTKKEPTTVTIESTTTEESTESVSTEQPEKTIKIIINGTVNCTTELSSSTLVLNTTNTNDSVWIKSEIYPRIPFINKGEIEEHTSLPNEIITNRVHEEDFDDTDSFTINVTSSLRTNTSSVHNSTTTTTSTTSRPKTVPPILVDELNASKSKKDELDYDYNEPTLPPSLPNLKIIPFVAADAVVDDDEIAPKETPTFTALEQDDRFPVYYPGLETKENTYPIRREDDYNQHQYPIFVTKKVETMNYPKLTLDSVNLSAENANTTHDQEFTVGASLGSKIDTKPNHSIDNTGMSAANLFSPPVETEGGFIPKGSGTIDEFYSLYPSTPAGPAIPHLTTSMQIETKEECISSNGQHISDGVSITMGCSVCICAWGELHCSPRPCHSPPGCRWRSASIHSLDLCCGELICDYESTTKVSTTEQTTHKTSNTQNLIDSIKPKVNASTSLMSFVESIFQKELEKDSIATDESVVRNDTHAELSTVPPLATTTPTSSFVPERQEVSEDSFTNTSQTLEYEDEDDDEGFSLGSVLKLLLRENYETKTTSLSSTKKTTLPYRVSNSTFRPTTHKIETTKVNPYETPNNFIPMPASIMPFKKLPMPNTITRIDHLLLGESNGIRESSPRPAPPPKPTPTTRKPTTKTTHQPYTSKPTSKKEIASDNNEVQTVEISQAPHATGFGLGLPKLAGCNIYGQMYRVGRIITELSSACQECRCTEFGVDCTPLSC